MHRGHVVPEVIESVQLDVRFFALGVRAADVIIAFHLFHGDKVFAIEMIIHHGRPTIGKCPLLHRHGFIADATRTLCLSHEQREPVGLRCFV